MEPSGTVFYTGEFKHSLDDKGRLTIPSAWRSAHGEKDTFLATPHPDGYISILPPGEALKLHAKFSEMKYGNAQAQAFAANFAAQSQSFTVDKAGRVILTEGLIKHAGIEKDAVLVGSMTKFNVYTPARWAQEQARVAGQNFGDLMRQMDF